MAWVSGLNSIPSVRTKFSVLKLKEKRSTCKGLRFFRSGLLGLDLAVGVVLCCWIMLRSHLRVSAGCGRASA